MTEKIGTGVLYQPLILIWIQYVYNGQSYENVQFRLWLGLNCEHRREDEEWFLQRR